MNHEERKIEEARQRLFKNTNYVQSPFGAGSIKGLSAHKRVKDVARVSLTTKKCSLMLSRLISQYNFKHVLELGTCLGINALYLSSISDVRLVTFEGYQPYCDIAQQGFDALNRKNIKLIGGDIDVTLPQYLTEGTTQAVDMVYIDANHTYEATMRYFRLLQKTLHERSIMVIDDIHWSREMKKAWNEIKADDNVSATIDIYDAGIVFFDPLLKGHHYVIYF